MNNKINLLKGSKTKRFQQEKILKILKFGSIGFLSLVVIASLALFVLNTRSPIDLLKNQEKTAISNISTLQERAGKLLFTENRVKDISGIVDKRTVFDGTITQITQIIPSEILVQSVSLDKKIFSLTITSPSLSSINTLVEGIETLAQDQKTFSKITLEGLTIDPKTGDYIVSILGNFP